MSWPGNFSSERTSERRLAKWFVNFCEAGLVVSFEFQTASETESPFRVDLTQLREAASPIMSVSWLVTFIAICHSDLGIYLD